MTEQRNHQRIALPDIDSDLNVLRWDSVAMSHIGHIRRNNEDAFIDVREQNLWAVADGMGGHSAGDIASQTIIDCLMDFSSTDDLSETIDDLENRIQRANTLCRERTRSVRSVMGSTAALLYTHGQYGFVMWAGDSRVYRLREGELRQISEDHSLVQELIAVGEITEEQAKTHPNANVITRAVGVAETLNIDIEYVNTLPGDIFLLCTDGLFRDISEEEIIHEIDQTPLVQASENLMQLALNRGGTDNITFILTKAQDIT